MTSASRTAAFLAGKYNLGWEFPGTIERSDWVQIAEPLKKRRPGLQVLEFPSNVVNDVSSGSPAMPPRRRPGWPGGRVGPSAAPRQRPPLLVSWVERLRRQR